jgi:DNA-binding NtrC family response regulator
VGGKSTVKVDVRVICASNKDLRLLLEEGSFREDLYYRLAVITVDLPPLNERREDIPLLAEHFIRQCAEERKEPPKSISEEAMALLAGFDWPGNVRQLRNEVLRAIALADRVIVPEILSDEIRLGAVPHLVTNRLADRSLKDISKEVVQTVERQVVREVLDKVKWKKTEAARQLGISRPTLDSKIQQYGLKRP